MKKTTEVIHILNYANNSLAREDEFADSKFKAGICLMIEEILFRTDNYKGFGFIYPHESGKLQRDSKNFYSRHYYINDKLK
jgi:hypothetical protein